METLIEVIERELGELEKIMKSGGYGFNYAKGFLREAKKHCEAGDLEKCLDYIRKAREGAEREKKIVSARNELCNVVRGDLSLERLCEEADSWLRKGDIEFAENILNMLRSKVEESRKEFERMLDRYRKEVRKLEEIFKKFDVPSVPLARAKRILDELQSLLARRDFEGFKRKVKELEAVLRDAENEAKEVKKRIPSLFDLLRELSTPQGE